MSIFKLFKSDQLVYLTINILFLLSIYSISYNSYLEQYLSSAQLAYPTEPNL